MKVVGDEKLPIKIWADEVEEGAMKQARNLANLPFTFKHIALMPDVHQGYGMPIGGVLATTDGYIVCSAVGVDIGCGMCALQLPIDAEDVTTEQLKLIMGRIRDAVPVGFDHHKTVQWDMVSKHMPHFDELTEQDLGEQRLHRNYPVIRNQFVPAYKQLGTLGGGNHFIEIQKGDNGKIWLMVHSGSRNIGYKVAKYYNDLAVSLNGRYFSSVPKNHELAFLHVDTDAGKHYMREMEYCVKFALANRKVMMEQIFSAFCAVVFGDDKPMFNEILPDMINIAHNYAAWENHFGKNVIVHRKGATRARVDEIGIIPGSQGSKSYIVKGRGNPDSFFSCSHGAGRKMSRSKARKELDLKTEIAHLDEQGIVHGLRHAKELDEATGAYKSIQEVMTNQKDLVEIVCELTPLANIKG